LSQHICQAQIAMRLDIGFRYDGYGGGDLPQRHRNTVGCHHDFFNSLPGLLREGHAVKGRESNGSDQRLCFECHTISDLEQLIGIFWEVFPARRINAIGQCLAATPERGAIIQG
jgi:hypothetical protein